MMGDQEFLLSVIVKVPAPNAQAAHERLYALLCKPGDMGFSINEYAVTGQNKGQVVFQIIDE